MSSLRIFLSSPGDVSQERLRAHLVIQKLARDYSRYFTIEPYLWEYEPMLASSHFQDVISPPSSCDIVVLILWSRLGTPLPEQTAAREYHGIDGRKPVTGTEWEFEEALEANRARGGKGPPDLLAYRRVGGAVASLDDASKRDESIKQYEALERFWERWFRSDGKFLAGYAQYGELDEFDRKLESDLIKIIQRRIKERQIDQATPIWLKGSPFRGLQSYDFAHASIFFGRDRDTREAVIRLAAAAEKGTAFLLLSGASGSGKSSLARAGILPALVAPMAVADVGLWRRVVMRPGDAGNDPILALARALTSSEPDKDEGLPELLGPQMTPENLAAHLRSGGDPAFLFTRALQDLAKAERQRRATLPHEQARLLLLVDQLDELFNRAEIDDTQREMFARVLSGLARSGVVWVVATIRSDLAYRVADVASLHALAQDGDGLTLGSPDSAQLFEMIRQPALSAGLVFETDAESRLGLDALIARDAAAEPGVLPLLSVMLDDLYRADINDENHDGQLRVATYRELGGLRAAIGRRADRVLDRLHAEDPEAANALPNVLRALVTSAADTTTARPALLASFPASSPELRLITAMLAPDARLLISEDSGVGPVVRLAHEALINNWDRARSWIKNNCRDIDTEALLAALMRDHNAAAAEQRTATLLTGLRLQQGLDLLARDVVSGNSPLGRFIETSAARRSRVASFRIGTAVAATLLIGILGVFGFQRIREWQAYDADRQHELLRTDIHGTITAFSTSPGEVASDGTGEHSPYLSGILTNIDNRYFDFTTVLQKANDVMRQNEPQVAQIAEITTSLNGRVYLQDAPPGRKAFVLAIGIGDYQYIPRIPNPAHDAAAFAAAFRRLGYNVDLVTDVGRDGLLSAISAFKKKIATAQTQTSEATVPRDNANAHRGLARIETKKAPDNTLAIVFFAGQGFQYAGVNYLSPRDFDPRTVTEKALNSGFAGLKVVSLNEVIEGIKELAAAQVFIIDTCRDNPFRESNR